MRKIIHTVAPLVSILFLPLGCSLHVFPQPLTISNKSIVSRHAKPIKQIQVSYSNYAIFNIPIVVNKPETLWPQLMEEAEAAGGNAVIDVQAQPSYMVLALLPGFIRADVTITGTAALIE